MEILNGLKGVPAPVGAYSQAVKVGNLLFCSGQIGLAPENGELREGLEAQTKQVLENIDSLLKEAGSSREQIAMSTIFLSDISNGKVVNQMYGDFVNNDAAPARQTVAVKDLPLGALVEISVIAEI